MRSLSYWSHKTPESNMSHLFFRFYRQTPTLRQSPTTRHPCARRKDTAVSPKRKIVLLLLLLLLPCLPGCNDADTVTDALVDGDNDAPFPFGVASGDVTSSRAVLWTRTRQATPLTLEVSTSATFTSQPAFMQTVSTMEAADFTVKVVVEGLMPGTGYFYRWQQGTASSATGTFRTAPA